MTQATAIHYSRLNPSMTTANHFAVPGLDDLCVRFIINLPQSDLSSVERICFAVEEAQWYYEDFIRPLDPSLPSLSLREFSLRVFAHCPLLAPFSQGDHMRAFDEFLKYKTRIPVRGAILLNDAMDSALLVKGWKKSANWSFPRGKINKDEDDLTCAIREVYEETGYDIEAAGLVPADRQVKLIAISMHDQQMGLYVFRGIPMDTHFEPRTRKEISKIQWWRLADLPAYRKKGHQQAAPGKNQNKFYMVAPFLPHLKRWIIDQKKSDSKPITSSQYLSAGVSHDDFLTEEEQGAESNTQDLPYATPHHPDIDTLEGTNEALRSLLKIQPITQGLQTEPMMGAQSLAAENKGGALLALLQGDLSASTQQAPSNVPPQTPLEHIFSQAPQPRTPHHQQPRPPHFSNLPPPLSFPIQPPSNSFSYQEPNMQNTHHLSGIPGFPQSQMQSLQQSSRPQANPHPYQPQHLVHPQPLPPHVQRAVFAEGPIHAPMVPRPAREVYPPNMNPAASFGTSNPQFPNIHAPMVPNVQKPPQPKLTSHSMALLNAFKSHDHANGDAGASGDLPLRRYAEEPMQAPPPRPQELPAKVSLPTTVGSLSQFELNESISANQNPNVLAPKPISEERRSMLLDLFKSPTAQTAVPVRPNASTAFPVTATPSAVELSVVEPLSSNVARVSPVVSGKRMAKKVGKDPSIPQMNPETNLPFRAVKILSRPTQVSDSENPRANGSAPQTQLNGKRPALQSKAGLNMPPEKPFQPQILQRPQPGHSKTAGSPTISGPSTLPILPILPTVDQQPAGTPKAHKQTLDSLLENLHYRQTHYSLHSIDATASQLIRNKSFFRFLDQRRRLYNHCQGQLQRKMFFLPYFLSIPQ